MDKNEEFEAWLAENRAILSTLNNMWSAKMGYDARQPEIDALKSERNAHRDNAQQLVEENTLLKAEVERLRPDAERIQWLTENNTAAVFIADEDRTPIPLDRVSIDDEMKEMKCPGGEIVKVSELAGPLLDLWVAKAEGYEIGKPREPMASRAVLYPFRAPSWKTVGCVMRHADGTWSKNMPRFSTDWSQGGPIIEREQFALIPVIGGTWCAERNVPTGGDDYEVAESHGSTPLIAAMRAYVASKFGDEVPDE